MLFLSFARAAWSGLIHARSPTGVILVDDAWAAHLTLVDIAWVERVVVSVAG
jgi:hypothetical protein